LASSWISPHHHPPGRHQPESGAGGQLARLFQRGHATGLHHPALAQRRAETEVLLKDGESFAIAGLINNQVTEVMNKVPVLAISRFWENCFAAAARRNRTTNYWW